MPALANLERLVKPDFGCSFEPVYRRFFPWNYAHLDDDRVLFPTVLLLRLVLSLRLVFSLRSGFLVRLAL